LDLDNRLNHELTKPIHPKPFQCLDIILKPICGQFDYVILDCPPNMYWTTKNGLFCADHIIIPTVPDFLSTAGLWRLVGYLKELRDQFLLYDPDPARISGVVFNMFGMRKVLMSDTIKDVEDELQRQRHEGKVFSKKVFTEKTRYLNAIAEAQEAQKPVTVYRPTCEASKDIIQLTQKIVEGL
jgi:chromosome partitioning protein